MGDATFTYDDVGGTVKLQVQDRYTTTSGSNFLAVQWNGAESQFNQNDTFTLTFAQPVQGIGLYFVMNADAWADDVSLAIDDGTVNSTTTLNQTLSDGAKVYFVGIRDTSGFTSATYTQNGAVSITVDDIVVEAMAAAPEINVERPASTTINDAGTDAQGDKKSSQQVTLTYTVRNTGTGTLSVSNIEAPAGSQSNVTVDSISKTNFSVAASGVDTVDVEYSPAAGDGSFSFELDITSDDGDEANYDITVSGTRDGTPPVTTAGAGPSNPSNDSNPTFAFTATDTGGSGVASSSATLSGPETGGPTSVTTGFSLSAVAGSALPTDGSKDGAYTMRVVSTDNVGNVETTATYSWTYDSTAPTGYSITADDVLINNAESTSTSFTFSGAEVGATYNYIVSSSGGGSNVTGSGTIATATDQITGIDVSGLGDGTLTYSVTLTDPAGNAGSAATDTATLDETSPTVTSSSRGTPTGENTNADTLVFRVTFDEEMDPTTVNTADFTADGTTAAVTNVAVATANTVFDVTVSGGNLATLNGTVDLDFNSPTITDAAGNALPSTEPTTDESYVVDNVAPTVAINQDGGQADPTDSSPINFAVVFSESVSNFATGDVTLTGTAGATTGTVTGSGTTYNVAVSGMTQDGTVTVAIEAGKATDAGGNPNAASTSTDDTVTYRNHPTIEKEFSPDTIGAGDTTTLTFTLANPNTLTTLTGLNFIDDLPTGVEIAATPNIGGTCNTNNVLATHFTPNLAATGTRINLVAGSNYSLAPGADCTITVDVTATSTGSKVNDSGNIGSTETGAGTDDAADTLTVGDPTLTVNVTGNFGTDNVTSIPVGINCPGDCTESYAYDTNVTLTVTVDPGSSFVGWSGDCSGTGNPIVNMKGNKTCTATFEAFPEIDVQRPASIPIADGGTDNLGDQAPGTINLTYTIDNSAGGAQLDVTDVTAPAMTNANNFNVSTAMPLNIAAGGTDTVEIVFDVDALGAFTVDMEIANNDSNENPYNIQITGTGAAVPEIDVLGNDTSIVSGDTTPSTANHTDFGNADFDGATIDRTFTIKNTGLADLDLTAGPPTIVIGGADAAEFTLKTDATTPVTAGGETTFTITFDPVDDTLKQATVTIANNDGDENPYTFNIQGMGTGPSCEIDVQGNGICIPHGDTSPSALDQTDFGEVLVAGGQVTYTYTIENTGSIDLTLTHNDHVMIGGAHAADFILTEDAHTPVVARGGTTTFEITFDPTQAGLREATITIDNDDNDEHPYTFKVQGTGIVPEEPARGSRRGTAPSTSRFPVGDGGGEFQADPVTMMVQPGTVPTGTQLFIERLPPRGDDPNIILGSLLFDISFLGPDGEYIYDFYPPIEICIKPTSREIRAAGGSFSNMNILAKHGSADWMMVPNPYERDGYLCVSTQRNSLFAIGVGYLPATGFAPGMLHSLPDQPAEKDYQPMDNFMLLIPELGVELPIIGVPLTEYGWDVTWLGDRAGYLEGTAFPTWAGNTAITAHVWDVNNDPGPFVNLHTLQHGDQVVIQAFGKHYLYEVRQIDKVRADNMSALPHDDYDVLTLITCQGYNERTGEYAWRIVVRAVLISVE